MRSALLLLALAATTPAAESDDYVWVEGESGRSATFKPHSWYSDAVRKEQLSGGAWLTTFDGPAGASANWTVQVPRSAEWTLWLRANPVQAGLDWRVDGGAWQAVDTAQPQDRLNIAADGKPDLRFVAWMRGGAARLQAGAHTVEVRTTATLNHHAGIDVLLLAAAPFTPAGKTRPGTVLSDAEPGCFAFAPPPDPFAAGALIDLRALNEGRAGERGRLAARGDDLVDGAGKPLRLWAANAGSDEGIEAARYLMRRLAKNGVNMVRLHGLVADRTGADPRALSPAAVERVCANVAAAAEQGIYVHLSTWFPLWLELKPGDGIEGAALGRHPFGLLLFEPRFQALYKAWAKALLTTRNPHTGKTLAEDPAVAVWELQNEDSLFFWTLTRENLGPGPWRTLCERFAAWARERHGSPERALAAWGVRLDDDAPGEGRLALLPPWDLTGDALAKTGPARQARVADQARFYAELTVAAYRELAGFLRQECGFQGLISASNWITADDRRLGALERWTYAASTDLVDRHGYFAGEHKGDAAGWSVRAGHTWSDRAAVLEPAATPLAFVQIAGRPSIISEIAWSRPNRFTADGVLLTASYAALQGVDGVFAFAARRGTWYADGSEKWPLMTPGVFGQFPAAALQYRRGDLAPAPVAVRRVSASADLLALRDAGVAEGASSDVRVPGASAAAVRAEADPLACLAGRVERVVSDLPGAPAGAAALSDARLAAAVDRGGRVVASLTGQLRWDWGRGLVTVDAPASQAATGFLAKAGEIRLKDVTIRCANEYATVHVISLDGAPLARSRRMLVQAFSEERLFGWRAAGGRIGDPGRAPINVVAIDASVTFAAGAGLRAQAADGNGMPAGAVAMTDGRLVLPRDRLYVVVSR
jgi:hypothetical protein